MRQLLARGAWPDHTTTEGLNPLHIASSCGHAGLVRLLLEASPVTAATADSDGGTALHYAAQGSRNSPTAAVVRLLLEAAPAAALAPDAVGFTPLHSAADAGNIEVMKMLLTAAPAAATMLNTNKEAAIHRATYRCNPAAVQLLLEAAPALAFAPDACDETPLHLALSGYWITTESRETARCLLGAAPAVQPALDILLQHSQRYATLFADLAARLPLSQDQWRSIPAPCPDLARALPAVLGRSTAEAGWLVGRLAEGQRKRLRAAALGLARAQRGVPSLPAELRGRILALCLLY